MAKGVVDNTIERIIAVRFGDIPVGKGFLYAVSLGMSDILIGLLNKFMPAGAGMGVIAGPGIAWAVKNVAVVKDFLGKNGAEIIATTAMLKAVNDFTNVTGMAAKTIGDIVGVVPSGNFAGGGFGLSGAPSRSALGSPVPARFLIPEISLGQPFISPAEPETDVERKLRLNRS